MHEFGSRVGAKSACSVHWVKRDPKSAQIHDRPGKNPGPSNKSKARGVPNPPKVINSIHKAITVAAASPLFCVGGLCRRSWEVFEPRAFRGIGTLLRSPTLYSSRSRGSSRPRFLNSFRRAYVAAETSPSAFFSPLFFLPVPASLSPSRSHWRSLLVVTRQALPSAPALAISATRTKSFLDCCSFRQIRRSTEVTK